MILLLRLSVGPIRIHMLARVKSISSVLEIISALHLAFLDLLFPSLKRLVSGLDLVRLAFSDPAQES